MQIEATSQPAIEPLPHLLQALLARLQPAQGTAQNSATPGDMLAFLAALQDAAHQCIPPARDATGLARPNVPPYPPLAQVTKPNLTTAELAYYLNRKPQTLRCWACRSGTGPMVAKRIGGLLAWATADAKRIAGVA